jgi:hypothetical protein
MFYVKKTVFILVPFAKTGKGDLPHPQGLHVLLLNVPFAPSRTNSLLIAAALTRTSPSDTIFFLRPN